MNRFEELARAARAAVRARQRRLPLEHLRELVRTAPPTLNATAVLRSRSRTVSVIAEASMDRHLQGASLTASRVFPRFE